ncbi:MAG TPA: T9SS type A sorting domain-containing protein [Flavobacteriales bacterium]|nr:T9SS type A sorting domain-containing protein [Flavobacteriales bacterium]HIN39790.1 T9SS type A sorting domain-containing protein [Flavobacteriales bacterium]
MKRLAIFVGLLLSIVVSKAQTTALDFNRIDCNGNSHHLYSELDSNNVVILEFIMLACNTCNDAGQDLTEMHSKLDIQFPGKVRFYHFGFDDAYLCSQITTWVISNGFNSTPFDSGAYQVAYYGGMAMPTVAVVGGPSHEVLFLNNTGFSTSDTGLIANAIRSFYGVPIVGLNGMSTNISHLQLSPNPTEDFVNLKFQLNHSAVLQIDIIDIMGKIRQEVINANYLPGEFNQKIDITSLHRGLYFLRFKSNGKEEYYKFTVAE